MDHHGEVHEEIDPVVGLVGTLTVSIPVAGPGEVVLGIRGGTEAFAAWCDQPLPRYARVLVIAHTGARSVTVTPFAD